MRVCEGGEEKGPVNEHLPWAWHLLLVATLYGVHGDPHGTDEAMGS